MSETDLAALLRKDPKLMRVLHAHGIQVCAGCVVTLTSPPARAAAFHGVPDIPAFLRALKSRSRRRHGRGSLASARRRRS